jgi:hypothetical protein
MAPQRVSVGEDTASAPAATLPLAEAPHHVYPIYRNLNKSINVLGAFIKLAR